jgi:flagellar basal-body rod protein FlgG
MEAQQTFVEVVANNMANVNTVGFKRSRAEFQDLLYQTLRPTGSNAAAGLVVPSGQEIGLGTKLVATDRQFTEGDLKQTGVPTDVAIQGDGFFSVNMPSGELAYTRAGALKLDSTGRLVTSDGYPLTANVTIPSQSTNLAINPDGTVSVQMPGQQSMTEVGKLTLVSFLYTATTVAGAPSEGQPGTNNLGTLAQGTLEMSNVQVVNEMVDLIVGQRAYDINSRVIKAADDMLQQTASLH